jgi:hypothetical protein
MANDPSHCSPLPLVEHFGETRGEASRRIQIGHHRRKGTIRSAMALGHHPIGSSPRSPAAAAVVALSGWFARTHGASAQIVCTSSDNTYHVKVDLFASELGTHARTQRVVEVRERCGSKAQSGAFLTDARHCSLLSSCRPSQAILRSKNARTRSTRRSAWKWGSRTRSCRYAQKQRTSAAWHFNSPSPCCLDCFAPSLLDPY